MKISQFIIAACFMALCSTTACKTAQTVQQQSSTTQQEQPVTKQFKGIDMKQLNGTWNITQALGKDVIGDKPVNIIFDIDAHRIYGNNGCNTFSGTLHIDKSCNISFTECLTTTAACRPEVTDGNVMQALAYTTYYNVVNPSFDETTIELLDKDGKRVALIERQLRDLLNGMWDVTEVAGKKVRLKEKPSMVIDIETGKLTGNSGCNIMNGGIQYDSNINNSISFTGIASTRRMCTPDAMEVEDLMLDAINKIDSFRIIDNNHIALCSSATRHDLITLQRRH